MTVTETKESDVDPFLEKMKDVDEEYFHDQGYVMSGTQVRPELRNIQMYSRSQQLRHTPWQMVRSIHMNSSPALN